MKNFHKYLPITQTEKDWGLYITTAGYMHISPNEQYPPQKGHPPNHLFTWDKGRILNGYYMVFIAQGEGIFESAFTSPRIISEGECFILFPNIWHRYKPNMTTGWEEYWVGFNGFYPQDIMNKTFFSPHHPIFEVGLNENLLVLFQRLLEKVQNAQLGYHQCISGILLEILGLAHTISVFKKQSENEDLLLIHKSMFLLRESLESPMDIKKLIHNLPMGYSKFRKLFKSETGFSPHQYHLNLRICKAKELLQTTQLNIKEITYQTGFESEFYFSKLFRKKVGMSPSGFRLKKPQGH